MRRQFPDGACESAGYRVVGHTKSEAGNRNVGPCIGCKEDSGDDTGMERWTRHFTIIAITRRRMPGHMRKSCVCFHGIKCKVYTYSKILLRKRNFHLKFLQNMNGLKKQPG